MEKETLITQPSGFYILNGQAVFIQNQSENRSISGSVNNDILQQAFNNLTVPANAPISEPEIGLSNNENIPGQSYVLLNDNNIENDRVVQLSISDDFPLQFLSTDPEKEVINESLDSSKRSYSLVTDKFKDSSNDLNGFLKLTPHDNSGNHYELVQQPKNKYTYAYQLTDGTKLCPVSKIDNGIKNVSASNVSSDSSNILINAQAMPAKITLSQPASQNSCRLLYVNKMLNGTNVKPQLLLNMKSKTVQSLKKPKKNHLITSDGKSFLINGTGNNVAVIPTPNSQLTKDIVKYPKLVISKDFKSCGAMKPVRLKSLLKPKPANGVIDVNSQKSEVPLVHNELTLQQSLLQEQLQLPKASVISMPTLPSKEQPNNEEATVGRLTEAELKRIASVFQNRTKITNSTIFDTETNTKILCRVLYPDDLIKDGEKPGLKRGRKRTRPNEVNKKPNSEDEKTKKPPPPTARTRSGRLSRPPRYMVKDFKKLTEDSEASYSDYRSDSDDNTETTTFLHLPNSQQRKFSTKYHCPSCGKVYLGKKMLYHFNEYPDHRNGKTKFDWEDENQENTKQQENKRNLWRKIFRKGSRKPRLDNVSLLKELFHACSDKHFIPAAKERIAGSITVWDFLKTRHSIKGSGVMGLLSDLTSLMESMPKNLLEPAQPEDAGSVHINDNKLCHILGIPPGYYLPNDAILANEEDKTQENYNLNELTPNIDLQLNADSVESTWDKCNVLSDQNHSKFIMGSSKIEIDDVSKEDSSELNELLSGKSALDSVDQIVSERLNDLIPSSPLDVSSLVENQVLTHSVLDSSPNLLHGVSGSTEDLIKTLETLTPDLPNDSTSNDFDFAVLSSDFTSDR